jgi:hypothetical protein
MVSKNTNPAAVFLSWGVWVDLVCERYRTVHARLLPSHTHMSGCCSPCGVCNEFYCWIPVMIRKGDLDGIKAQIADGFEPTTVTCQQAASKGEARDSPLLARVCQCPMGRVHGVLCCTRRAQRHCAVRTGQRMPREHACVRTCRERGPCRHARIVERPRVSVGRGHVQRSHQRTQSGDFSVARSTRRSMGPRRLHQARRGGKRARHCRVDQGVAAARARGRIRHY